MDRMQEGEKLTVTQAILQITIIDIIFSFDSILTAVGLSRDIVVMITAVIISMFVMLLFTSCEQFHQQISYTQNACIGIPCLHWNPVDPWRPSCTCG